MNYRGRIALLKAEIQARRLDSLLITNKVNVSYLSGFSGDDSLLLITPGRDFFITDSRYIEEAKESIKGYDVRLIKRSTYDTLKAIARSMRLKRIGFESMDLPYGVAARLKKLFDDARLVPIKGLVEDLRTIKDDSEVELIKAAIRLTKNTFEKIKKLIRPAVTEESVARSSEIEFIRNGARSAFMPIVASGANSSKPHAAPTGTKIANNSFVMIDMGCRLKGYCADITRMVTVGKLQEKFVQIYNIVHTAQTKAIDAIRPGVNIAEVDLCARRYIQKNGFDKHFAHAAGHGVGMEVHEPPSVSRMSENVLKPGMVFTIEPAIYIPRFGGVRIEDMVLVTDKGCEVLTR